VPGCPGADRLIRAAAAGVLERCYHAQAAVCAEGHEVRSASRVASLPQIAGAAVGREPGPSGGPRPADRWGPRSRAACALGMSRREMLGKREVAAPLMAQRATHGARRPAHRRFQPGAGVGVQLAGLRLSGKPHRPSQRHLGHQTPVLRYALTAPAAPHPRQHCAVRRQRGRQVAPCGHTSTIGQRLLRLVLPDDQQERRRTCGSGVSGRALIGRTWPWP